MEVSPQEQGITESWILPRGGGEPSSPITISIKQSLFQPPPPKSNDGSPGEISELEM